MRPRRDSVRVEQDAFTKRVEVLADADVEIAATPATFAGAELYHSIRLRRVSQRQLQDLRITLVPRSWRIDAGTYQGQTLPIDAEVAMRRVSEGAPFWRLAPVSGLGPRTILGWRESDLPSAGRAGIPAFASAYATGEPREGAAAFLEKRPPRFGAPR